LSKSQSDQVPPLLLLMHQLVPLSSLPPPSLLLSPLSIFSEHYLKWKIKED